MHMGDEEMGSSHDALLSPRALKKGGKKVSTEEAAAILAEVDSNQDGVVSFDEFVHVFEIAPLELHPRNMSKVRCVCLLPPGDWRHRCGSGCAPSREELLMWKTRNWGLY